MGVTAILAVSAVVGAVSAVKQGQAARKESKARAAINEQQAQQERKAASAAESDFRRKQSRFMAERRAGLGGSGVQVGTGSPLLAAGDFADEVELQALRIREGGDLRATRLEQQAELTRRAGRNAETRGRFRAGSSLLSGASKIF